MAQNYNGNSPVSAHRSIEEMYARTRELNLPTVFDRYRDQQPQCKFGQEGICCQLCSHGPCRITPQAPRGICGATADTIVARNLVRLATHGAAAYTHHLEEVCRTIKAAAAGQGPFRLQNEQKLREVASALGLNANLPAERLAAELADLMLAELRKAADEPLLLVEKLAPPARKEIWARLGVIPGGVLAEVRDALTKSMTNIDSDPIDLLLTALRLALATGFLGLIGTVTLQDILLGTPAPTRSQADLGILDPAYVNIVAHGHVPLMATAVLQEAQREEMQALAREAGAKGIRVLGSMCTGQELLQRMKTTARGFAGQTGNWITQEFLVATGAVDLVMMDMNCSIPALKLAADRFHTRLVSVDRILRLDGVEEHVDYDPVKAREQAQELIRLAVEAYRRRAADGSSRVHIPPYRADVLAGFSVEAILDALGGSLDPLLASVRSGSIRGIAAVVGCTNNRNGHDFASVALTRELIRRDILVLNAGCVSSAVQSEGLMRPEAAELAGEGLRSVCQALGIPPCLNFGSCVDIGRIALAVGAIAGALGVDPAQLPVAASAPEYLEQKAVADGIFAVALGLLTHLAPIPPVTGSSLVTKVLTEDLENLTGGKFLVEPDPVKAAEAMAAHIEGKRKALGL
ncbi:MAG: anaerobic carbon-monoxide dehydrogenase catalytic subunit [Bacillota bacterium]|nr:anaerobic carbon-monoxide dehydrogenase catalytic subunit [Bacillota bacterium]